ncbi:creatininase family protein [bacterium]|nr:creatininase family protein [bacterium]
MLPFGATEPHNLHLPYATDTIEADLIAGLLCQRAHERGASIVCLPTIPYGTETNQQGFPFAMNLQPSTVLAVLRDLVLSLEKTGIQKCVILNSHGGNAFKGMLRELFGQTRVHLFLINWYAIKEGYSEIFAAQEDHAGEMETSLILYARPDLVDLGQADEGSNRPLRFEAVQKGWVEITRDWRLLTTNSGSGDPRQATAEKGKAWLERIADKLVPFLVELSTSPVDEHFPFQK